MQVSGVSAAYGIPGSGTPAPDLEARLARLQQELSECVSCASAKLPEGKAKIQAVSDKIAEVKARMDAIAVLATRDSDVQVTAKSLEAQQVNRNRADYANNPVAGGTLGSVINIRA